MRRLLTLLLLVCLPSAARGPRSRAVWTRRRSRRGAPGSRTTRRAWSRTARGSWSSSPGADPSAALGPGAGGRPAGRFPRRGPGSRDGRPGGPRGRSPAGAMSSCSGGTGSPAPRRSGPRACCWATGWTRSGGAWWSSGWWVERGGGPPGVDWRACWSPAPARFTVPSAVSVRGNHALRCLHVFLGRPMRCGGEA